MLKDANGVIYNHTIYGIPGRMRHNIPGTSVTTARWAARARGPCYHHAIYKFMETDAIPGKARGH